MDQGLVIENDRPLSELSTFGIGGPARWYVEVLTVDAMRQALKYAQEHFLHYIILGKGSNCLFNDQGFNGLVIHNKIDFLVNEPANTFHVGAGFNFSRLGALTARRGYGGLEFASGIPGSVGGAVYMNAGANGHETCEALTSVDFVEPNGSCVTLQRKDLAFAYRTSPFQQMPGAIVGATFTLSEDRQAREKQLGIVNYRTKTQPYSDKSAGCIFRNPPNKSAGALIDQVGLKGLRVGGAAVSGLHANFIVNDGKASAQDVKSLISKIQEQVQKQSGVALQTEVLCIPYEGPYVENNHD